MFFGRYLDLIVCIWKKPSSLNWADPKQCCPTNSCWVYWGDK